MKVGGFNGPAIDAYMRNSRAEKTKPAAGSRSNEIQASGSSGDQVSLSGVTQEAMKAAKVASESPDARTQKVATIKDAIQRGEYQIDLEVLAQRLAQTLK